VVTFGLSGVGVGVGSGLGLKLISGSNSGGLGCACGTAFWSFCPCGGLVATFCLGGTRMTGDLAATFFLGGGVTGMGVKGMVSGSVATIGGLMGWVTGGAGVLG
jgi:hypothetical protein